MFGSEGGMWDLIVLVPDHCLSFYCTCNNSIVIFVTYSFFFFTLLHSERPKLYATYLNLRLCCDTPLHAKDKALSQKHVNPDIIDLTLVVISYQVNETSLWRVS